MKRIIRSFIRFIFFCIITLTLFFLIFVYSSKRLIKRENLGEYIKSADILNIEANIIFNLDEENITINEKLYELGVKKGIPDKIMIDILKSKEINLLLGEYFNKSIYYLINTIDKPKIEDDVIYKINNVAADSLNDHINIMMDEDELEIKIKDFCNELTNIIPKRQESIGSLSISFIRYIINFNYYILYIILVLSFLYYFLSTKSLYKPIRYFGLSFIIVGFLYVILGSLNNTITNIIVSNVFNLKILIEPLITILLTIFFKTGVLISFSGLFLVIIYIIMNRISINKELFNK